MKSRTQETPAAEGQENGLLYSMVRKIYFSTGFVYIADCRVGDCRFSTGKRPAHSQALKSVLDHLGAKHDITFR